ncbi:MAG: glycosyltransferase [Clostridia bacterium]|nr:glycosyltransferase [Clostridia bacterium]
MKIAVFCEVLGEANNGTTIAALNLIDYLKKKGHDVRVICPDEDKRGLEGYYILPSHKKDLLGLITRKNDIILPIFDSKIMEEAIKDVDVVHFMIPLYISKKASKFAQKKGKVITAGFHAQAENVSSHLLALKSKLVNHLIYKWQYKSLYSRANAIHYPTQFIRDIFEGHIKKQTNGYVISNGVNSIFKPIKVEKPIELKDKFCILFTGRLSKEKSHMVLLKAVSKSKYKDKIQLLFAGNGPLQKKIERYSKKHLSNQPIINFYSREELLKVINYCDLYCHPSIAEIEAISCLEAITSGLVPIIANSPLCATKSFAIDERCLFKVEDSTDLASKIDYFIENPEEVKKLRERYLAESVKFDQENCMKQMEEMFEKEISRRKDENK